MKTNFQMEIFSKLNLNDADGAEFTKSQLWGSGIGYKIKGKLAFVLFYSMLTSPLKKVHEFPVSSRDVTNQTPPGQE